MSNSAIYFELAKNQEAAKHQASALLMYLSSFCASFNSGEYQYPYQTTEKIRRLQHKLSLSDAELLDMVHSYGPLTDPECRLLLLCCIYGNLSGINSILSGGGVAYGY